MKNTLRPEDAGWNSGTMGMSSYRRRSNITIAAILVLGTILASGIVLLVLALLSTPAQPRSLDLTTVTPCPEEDGPYPGPLPCVWDSATRGNGQAGPGMPRWYLYAETCPVATLQPASEVQCVELS